MIEKIHILLIGVIICLFNSCIEEHLKAENTENAAAYLLVRGGRLLSSVDPLIMKSKDFGYLLLIKTQDNV